MTNNNLEQTDIFSLFGIKDEYAEKKKKEEEERMKKQAEVAKKIEEAKKNASTTSNKKSAEEFEVNSETIIYFYTETIDINEYFTTEELENGLPKKKKDGEVEYQKISKNDVKNRLKKDLPVLDAGAELVYIKKKNIVSVILQAKKKGNCNKESNTDSFSSSNRRKIPFSLLRDFISIAKFFSDQFGTEVHGDIYFDLRKNEFVMDIPEQIAHPYWVETTLKSKYTSAERFGEGNHIKCMEIHSHHCMPSIPSAQDNESERFQILYAIVGRIDKFFPELTVRTFDSERGKHINLNIWSIFEYPFSEISSEYDLSVVEVVE